ncbi:hypothetical protein [Vibrio palustris]|uniref:CbrC family protein n=1 Tax=Vibrio palustris TaxID=1918946 RepID=A0A1R4B6I5_9VIBR|nr:hypothetical protein [Vibrio palustris]SJL84529.1 hypothetical protein VPAL9027_02518 [Vibrio palustris]
MGKIFELISDDALEESDYSDECSFCGEKGVPIYKITGLLIEPGQYQFQDIPEDMENSERDEACESCLKAGKIKLFSEWEIEPILKKHCNNPAEQLEKIRSTPTIPLFLQGLDWVVCCGELCEFKGSPKTYDESIVLVDSYQFWHKGPEDWKTFWSSGFTLEPESLDEVSKFECHQCNKNWFIWQNT